MNLNKDKLIERFAKLGVISDSDPSAPKWIARTNDIFIKMESDKESGDSIHVVFICFSKSAPEAKLKAIFETLWDLAGNEDHYPSDIAKLILSRAKEVGRMTMQSQDVNFELAPWDDGYRLKAQ